MSEDGNEAKGDNHMTNSVLNYYNSFGEREWSRLDREPLEFTVNWHYINKYLPPTGHILDNGAGICCFSFSYESCAGVSVIPESLETE